MVEEVLKHGRLLNLQTASARDGKRMTIEQAAIAVTADNFDPSNRDKRPPAWKAIRYKRVLAREDNPPHDFMFQPGAFEKIEMVCGGVVCVVNVNCGLNTCSLNFFKKIERKIACFSKNLFVCF